MAQMAWHGMEELDVATNDAPRLRGERPALFVLSYQFIEIGDVSSLARPQVIQGVDEAVMFGLRHPLSREGEWAQPIVVEAR